MTSRPPSRRRDPSQKSASRLSDPQALIAARRRFLEEGIPPGSDVPLSIVRSWRRSAEFGLDMDARPDIEALSHGQLRETQERNEGLVRAARGEIEALYDDARTTGGIVILTDPGGVVLASVGNIEFAERASRVALRPGVGWAEASIGTNAIGTALAEGREIAVLGAEHFFGEHRILSCSAVPILDPCGAIVGVLDLSNGAEVQQTHTLALVKRAVDQIERRLFERRFAFHEKLRIHMDPGLIGSSREGVLAFEDDRLVGANRHALTLLGLDWSVLGRVHFDELFQAERQRLEAEAAIDPHAVRTLRGSTLFAQFQPSRRMARTPQPVEPRPSGPPADAFEPFYDERLLRMLERATRLADADLSILLQGEVGSGKEIFARRLHAACRRRTGVFTAIDCSQMSEAALETALFGAASGGETGEATIGEALERARGGVLLLQSVECLSPRLQARLARVLRQRMHGSQDDAAATLDLTLISATHHRLSELVSAGRFHQDLFFLIAAYTVDLEPVRRHGDLSGPIAAIWARIRPAGVAPTLPTATLDALAAYHWPGNHRQLVATLRALAVLAEAGEDIGPEALPQEIREARDAREPAPAEEAVGVDVEVGLETITLAAMRSAVEAEGGNVSRAARRLGIHRSTLYRRLYGVGRGG